MKLKDFTVIAEHPEHFEIGHPGGKTIKVPKQGLSEIAHAHIGSMKRANFDEGGGVDSADKIVADAAAIPQSSEEKSQNVADNTPESFSHKFGSAAGSFIKDQMFPGLGLAQQAIPAVKDAITSQPVRDFASGLFGNAQSQPQQTPTPEEKVGLPPSQVAPQASPNQQAGMAAMPSMQAKIQDPYAMMNNSYKLGVKGSNDYAAAMGQAGDAQAKAAGDFQAQMQKLTQDSGAIHQKLLSEVQKSGTDYANQKIDPMKFWNDKSTGSKISTAFGLILGGMGGGLLKQDNPAMKFLESNMKASLDNQMKEADQKNNVYRHNLEILGNHDDATKMTLAQMMEAYKVHVAQIAAQSVNPAEKAKAEMLNSEMGFKISQLTMPIAQRQAVMSMMNQPQTQSLDPASKVGLMGRVGILSPEQQTKANEEIKHANQIEMLRNDLHKSFHHLESQFLHGALSPADRQSAIDTFAGRLVVASDNRFNSEQAKSLSESIFQRIFEGSGTSANKLERMDDLLDTLRGEPTLNSVNIHIPSGRNRATTQTKYGMK